MMTKDADREKSYKVGYKKPPAEHRFRPGESGNPSGKRKNRNASTADADGNEYQRLYALQLNRSVFVMENGQRVSLTVKEALVRATIAKGMRGDYRAAQAALQHAAAADQRRADDSEALFITMSDYHDEWKATGFNPSIEDPSLPDPRNIRIDYHNRKAYDLTPTTPDQKEDVLCLAVMRDSWLEELKYSLNEIGPRTMLQQSRLESLAAHIVELNNMLPAQLCPELNPNYAPPQISLEAMCEWTRSKAKHRRKRKPGTQRRSRLPQAVQLSPDRKMKAREILLMTV